MPAFNERVLALTQDKLLPAAMDTVLGSNFLALRLILGKAKPWTGHKIYKAIKYKVSPTGGPFSGLDTFDTNAIVNKVRMSWDPTGYYQNVTIPGIEKAVNATSAQVTPMVANAIDDATQDMADGLGDVLYGSADGTGKQFTGLLHIILDSGTIGGLARSTYSTLDATVTASGGTIALTDISTLISNVSLSGSTKNRPTYFVCNETVWDLIEQLYTPTIRHTYGMMTMKGPMKLGQEGTAGFSGGNGFVAVTYRGIPIVADEKATSQTLFAINENYLDFYGLKHPDLKPINLGSKTIEGGPYEAGEVPSKAMGLQWTGFKIPTNQLGEVGQVILLGNLVSFNPGRQGRLTGITSV